MFDLPQIHAKPSADMLISVLNSLKRQPTSWDKKNDNQDPPGLEKYLIGIVASPLPWIQDDIREEIWRLASVRLSERAGRSAMSALDRTFEIPTGSESIRISIHEPALTMDNLGLKTWMSSYILSRGLYKLVPARCRALELGSGTGLVGMAAAAIWAAQVIVTDLPEITKNLARNVAANSDMLEQRRGRAFPGVLDWESPSSLCLVNGTKITSKFPVILAADSIYHESHPQLLAQTIKHWLSPEQESRVLVALPVRPGYQKELDSFRLEMKITGLNIEHQEEQVGYDDWGTGGENDDGQVTCWISIWKWC